MPARNVLQYEDWGWFTSQLDNSGSGGNNCAQASLVAAALAANTVDRGRSWTDLINAACLITRGYPNNPATNPYTSYGQLEAGLNSWQLDWEFTYDYGAAMQAPWSIILCSGATLRLADGSQFYPDSWFGGSYEPNHFVVWGPALDGNPYLCMNPLSYYNGDSWAAVDPSSWVAAFGSAHILHGLPVPEAPTPTPPPGPDQLAPARFRMLSDAGMKAQPAHGGSDIYELHAGDQGDDSGKRAWDASTPPDASEKWGYLSFGVGGTLYPGWVPSNKKLFERIS